MGLAVKHFLVIFFGTTGLVNLQALVHRGRNIVDLSSNECIHLGSFHYQQDMDPQLKQTRISYHDHLAMCDCKHFFNYSLPLRVDISTVLQYSFLVVSRYNFWLFTFIVF